MKHLYVDTNVVLDLLLNRPEFADNAERLFDLAAKGKVKLYLCATSYTDIYYFVNKSFGREKAIAALFELDALTETVSLTRKEIIAALKSDFVDFEDAVQHQSALSDRKVQGIISRDKKGFKKSKIPVWSPDEILLELA